MSLSKTYGENIFKAIVEGHDERFVADLQKIKNNITQAKDFHYPAMHKPGQSPMASILNNGGQKEMSPEMKDIVCTKAPWAK